MQNLPIILSVFAAAAAIIAVLLWRIKPQAAPNTEALDNRIIEETRRAETLQAKIDANEKSLREALVAASAANATSEAAKMQAASADANSKQVKNELAVLQSKYSEVEPHIARATEQRIAAENAQAEAAHRHGDLAVSHAALQAEAKLLLERSTKAEKDAAAAMGETEAVRQRASLSDTRVNEAAAKLNDLHTALSTTKSLLAEAAAQLEATEKARAGLDVRLNTLSEKHDALQADFITATGQASSALADLEHQRIQIDGMSRTIETLDSELTTERAALVAAVTKLQSDEASASQFKIISQEILDKTLEDAKRNVKELSDTFQKSSGLELEKHADKISLTMEPLKAQLVAYNLAVESLKKGTQENYGSLREQLNELQKTERLLHDEAKALTFALSSSPKVKGNYGEMILKQLVEFVGMQDKCHFETQASRETEEGRKIPDLVVSLPGGQKVLVDSKAVMDACVEAQKCQDDKQRTFLLKKHCDNVRSRVADLSSKNYYADHQDAIEAVVLFLPAENLYATAMENDPSLTEYAMGKNIILCGPNSLMLLLKVSNQLWRRAAVEKEVKDIRDCGEKIYKSACDFVDKFASIGKKIQSLESEYNGAVATFEGRLLPAGRRMSAFESVSNNKEIGEVEPIKDNVREFKEATKQLAARTPKLIDLIIGDETAELAFSAGEE